MSFSKEALKRRVWKSKLPENVPFCAVEIKCACKISPYVKCDFEAAQISHLTKHVKPVHVEIN